MKTPKEWLAHIKQASDTEVRYGSSVILLESDIEAIFMEGWKMGMTNAANIGRYHAEQYPEGSQERYACNNVADNIAINESTKQR